MDGLTPPKGWVGKVWALHQGSVEIKTPFTLLIDADIECDEVTLQSIFDKTASRKNSISFGNGPMRIESRWDKLMIPAFIYFLNHFILFVCQIIQSTDP